MPCKSGKNYIVILATCLAPLVAGEHALQGYAQIHAQIRATFKNPSFFFGSIFPHEAIKHFYKYSLNSIIQGVEYGICHPKNRYLWQERPV